MPPPPNHPTVSVDKALVLSAPPPQSIRYYGTDLARVAVGETVILLHPLLPLVGFSIWMERGCQQNDSLADG